MNSVREVTVLNKIYILSFTSKGYVLAEKLASSLEEYDVTFLRVKNIQDLMPKIFEKSNVIVFIGAVGIAVRSIAKFIKHKSEDPAVICIDEKGEYVIPILSGHIGGANKYSNIFTEILGATAIITTATDINKVFSIDSYAQENGYYIPNPENIKYIATNFLEKKDVGIFSDFEIKGDLPQNVVEKRDGNIGVYIGIGDNIPFDRTLILRPKLYHIGMGCKKDTLFEDVENIFFEKISDLGIDIRDIATISSIDLKSEEVALLTLSEKYKIPFYTYSKEVLGKYEELFEKSEFVKKVTGVSCVCEASAYHTSNKGELILNKYPKNGVTIAIAKERWVVSF